MTSKPEAPDRRQLLKDALLRLDEMQARLDTVEQARREPIAIIGMSCRFPGGANNLEAYWDLMVRGVDAIREVPPERWNVQDYAGLDPDTPPIWYGGFLDQIDGFDPQFFGISPREAITMDPQQRLVLEVGWEALESAGKAPDQLGGSQTGVFIGITTNDYGQLSRQGDPTQLDVYVATGGALNAAPGRLAYTLGLQGPCMAIDTACSSSLVAVHLACQSLRTGESNLALAGGVNAILIPEAFICFARWGMMAPDGRCKTFDTSADGFVRGEGCGVIVLKRLSDALSDGDNILAVIRGSAVNQDGRSSGLTVPNGPAQQAVVRKALAFAGVQPNEVSYIEAHGTGTAIGDPIEVEAVGAVLGQGRAKDQPLLMGSVKTNIGHCESASGIAGLIKIVLSMQHGEIPQHLHFHEPSPRIPWPDFPITIPTEQTPWKPYNGRRLAGVSGFGFSGTNAHVVLEEAPVRPATALEVERSQHILAFSARTEPALHDLAQEYRNHFAANPQTSVADAAFTAFTGRVQFPHRLAVIGATADEMRDRLAAFLENQEVAGVLRGTGESKTRPKIAFLFTGQGSQYVGMGRGLYETQPVFRAALEQCDQLLRPYLKHPLLSVLYPPEGFSSPLDETTYTQPALFALEYALARLWMSWGIQPSAVMGHSVGEYVAACIAGVFSLEDGLKLIAERGRLMGELPTGGQMAAVFADEATVAAAVAPYADQVSLAAVNGPENIVISGAGEAVEAVLASLNGIKFRKLNVSHAFHSPLMQPMLTPFGRVASEVSYSSPRIKLISNVSGAVASAEVSSADYWRQHVREAVQFARAMETLHNDGHTIYLEIGPSPTLISMGQRCLPADVGVWLSSLRSGRDDWGQMLNSLGALYVHGLPLDWTGFEQGYVRHKVMLPTYPFQRERYWADFTRIATTSTRMSSGKASAHPLLGSRVNLAQSASALVWENEISLRRYPYLDDHRVQGVAIVPATAYVEMGMEAVIEAGGQLPLVISEVHNKKPLFLREGAVFVSQVVLNQEAHDRWSFSVYSRPIEGDVWTLHVSGKVRQGESKAISDFVGVFDSEAVLKRVPDLIPGEAFYRQLAEKGNQWGTTFQGIERLWRTEGGEALSYVRVPSALQSQVAAYQIHPAVSDSCGHVLTATIPIVKSDHTRGGAFVGGGVDESHVYARPSSAGLWCYARLRPTEPGQDENILIGDVAVFDEDNRLISETLGARLWYLDHDGGEDSAAENIDRWFYDIQWLPSSLETSPAPSETWLIVGDAGGVAEALVSVIEAQGGRCVVVHDDIERQLADISDYQGVIHLTSLDAVHAVDLSLASLDAAVESSTVSALKIVQTLARLNRPTPPRVWFVTSGTQLVISAESVEVAASPLWGFGRSLALEHSELWGGLIDLDPRNPASLSANQLWAALHAPPGEDQQAYRGEQYYVARLSRKSLDTSNKLPLQCQPDGSYLITGGLGGLGLEFARWLAGRGARRLILMGRTALPPRKEWSLVEPGSRPARQIAAVRGLEALGVTVHLVAVDSGDEAQLRAFFEQYQAEGWPPIRGVIHAAGVMQYQSLLEHTPEEMRRILRAKVQGSWLLHDLLSESPLDFFVLFSSISVLLSSPLIASYAAANAFLDALAHYRRSKGLPALSINWGAWGEVGMIADFGSGDQTNALMQLMSTDQALEAFGRAFGQPSPQIAIMSANWKRWEKLYSAMGNPPFLSELMKAEIVEAAPEAQSGFTPHMIRAVPVEELPGLLESYLVEQISRALGFAGKVLDTAESLSNLGMDSLMAVELKNRIEKHLGLVIPVAHLLQGPSTNQLVTMLLNQLQTTDAAPVQAGEVWEEGEL